MRGDAGSGEAARNGATDAAERVCSAERRNFLRFNLRCKEKTSRKTIKPRAGALQ